MIPRRQMLSGAISTLVAIHLPPKLFAGEDRANSKTSFAASSAFGIMRPTHKAFAATLDRSFPGLASSSYLKDLLRYSALVQNRGSRPVYLYTYWWKGETQNGAPAFFSRPFYASLSNQGRACAHSGGKPVLEPREIGLVTPMFFWAERVYRRLQVRNKTPRVDSITEELAQFFAQTSKGRIWMKKGGWLTFGKYHRRLLDTSAELLTSKRNGERLSAQKVIDFLRANEGISASLFAEMLGNGSLLPPNLAAAEELAAKAWANVTAHGVARVGISGMKDSLIATASSNVTKYKVKQL